MISLARDVESEPVMDEGQKQLRTLTNAVNEDLFSTCVLPCGCSSQISIPY